MAEKEAEGKTCARPGCYQPDLSLCASCRLVGYCGRTCQVEDWPRHKEVDCQGHLRKVGMAHLQKSAGFYRDYDHVQTLRYSELALVKLKQLNDRPIEVIDEALTLKFDALSYMGRDREALECATERYCLYETKHTHPPAINASFGLIESCIHNNEFVDAVLYSRTTWETITLSRDSHIPEDERQYFTANGAYHLASAILKLAMHGNVPPEANQTAGQEAIGLARRALDIHTQMHGLENEDVANDISLLADTLDYFNNVDDDEVLRLYEQAIAIHVVVEGSSSVNVATCENNLAEAYRGRAMRARAVNDLDRELANLELALLHYREAVRIHRTNNHVDNADDSAKSVVEVEEELRQCIVARTAATTTTLG